MVDVLIRPTQAGDAELLAERMRACDVAEVHAYGHHDIAAAVRSSVGRSMLCWTSFADGEIAAIMGVAPVSVLGGVGSPWMLGTPVLDKYSRILVRKTPEYIRTMLNAFPHLVNYVHADNVTSIRWLQRIGFTMHDAAPFGARGEPFHRFEMRA